MIESGGVTGQPEGLIRRSDAIRIIDELLEQMTEDGCLTVIGDERVKELKEDLEKLPTARQEPPWITCNEKLPDYGHRVLISAYDWVAVARRISLMYGVEEEKDGWIDCDGELLEPEDMYAWMPFPEPYKGGKE